MDPANGMQCSSARWPLRHKLESTHPHAQFHLRTHTTIDKTNTRSEERDMVQQERARLVEANQTRTRYMSAIAHDLKT